MGVSLFRAIFKMVACEPCPKTSYLEKRTLGMSVKWKSRESFRIQCWTALVARVYSVPNKLGAECVGSNIKVMHNRINTKESYCKVFLKYGNYLSTSKDDRGSWRLGSVGDSYPLGGRLWKGRKVNVLALHSSCYCRHYHPLLKLRGAFKPFSWRSIITPHSATNLYHFSNFQVNNCSTDSTNPLTSSMTTQICFTHSIIECAVPATVMARSVEFGSMSPATCTWAPVDCKNKTGNTKYRNESTVKKKVIIYIYHISSALHVHY